MPFRSSTLSLLVLFFIVGYTSVGFLVGYALGGVTAGMISAATSLLVGFVLLIIHDPAKHDPTKGDNP